MGIQLTLTRKNSFCEESKGNEDLIDLYREIERKRNLKPKELVMPESKLSQFEKRLISVAKQNDYIIYSKYGQNPKVVLLGFTHSKNTSQGNVTDQEDNLVSILEGILDQNDIIMEEGLKVLKHVDGNLYIEDRPLEPDIENYNPCLVKRLSRTLKAKNARFILNDSAVVLWKFWVAKEALKKNPGDIKKIEEYMRSFIERDKTFCLNKEVGILPFANGTAEWGTYDRASRAYIQGGLPESSRIYFLVGLDHINAGIIPNTLRENKINFMTLVPILV